MWGIFGHASLSRFLEFKVRKDNCDPGDWPGASHKITVYHFFPKAILIFLKKYYWPTLHIRYQWL